MDRKDFMYYKIMIFNLKHNNKFIKCTINDNKVECPNPKIVKDLNSKVDSTRIIKHISFYVSLYDYGMEKDTFYYTIENLQFEKLPVYNKKNDLMEFLTMYKNILNSIKCYETLKFQHHDANFDKEGCMTIKRKDNTNYEFEHFKQMIYHAGNRANLSRYGLLYSQSIFKYNAKSTMSKAINVTHKAVVNTLNYMFDYLKRGIMVGIKSGQLTIFLPFSNINYENDFYEELYFDENDKKLLQKYKKTKDKSLKHKMENTVRYYFKKYNIPRREVIYDRTKWFGNNCFFRHDYYEGEKNVMLYESMMIDLCKERKINDCIFFLNIRDFPVLRKDRKHPYTAIMDRQIPKQYIQDFCPILSVGGSDEYDDIPLITQDDWTRVCGKYFPESCSNSYIGATIEQIPWQDKKSIAIFRGAASGCGTTELTNVRLKALKLSELNPTLLDVGITSFNKRIKKTLNKPLDYLHVDELNLKKATFINNNEKASHKYILYLDGHVSAFRLSYELSMKSVVLIPVSKYHLWFSKLLIPFEHFVPVKHDLSDLIDVISWCKNNDSKCQQIALNAFEFYNNNLQKEHMLNYMEKTLNRINLTDNVVVPRNKIAIIACYRDNDTNTRLKEKNIFLFFMSKMLNNLHIEYKIIVVEQKAGDKFNIGKLKNIGFDYINKLIKSTFDNYIFSDIDTLPDVNLLPYYTTAVDGVASLAINGSRYSGKPGNFYGACISCTKNTFIKLNGYSNLFTKGWGGEDDNLQVRVLMEKLTNYIPKNGSIIDTEETDNGLQKPLLMKIKEEQKDGNYAMNRYELLLKYELYKEDGLSNLTYDIEYEQINGNIHHIIVDPHHEQHELNFPDHFDVSAFTNQKYKDYQKKFPSSMNKVKYF